jgi:hypothetical protein
MMKRIFLSLGAAAALFALIVAGCGRTAATTATGCDANLPCTVSTNIN